MASINKAAPVAGGWAGAVMIWAGAVIIWAGGMLKHKLSNP